MFRDDLRKPQTKQALNGFNYFFTKKRRKRQDEALEIYANDC
jgi:hypothetical protein